MKTLLATTALAALLVATPAQADIVHWADAAGWDISVDTTDGNGCFATGAFDNGDSLHFGISGAKRSVFLMLGAPDPNGVVETGKTYALGVQFDDRAPWKAEFVAAEVGGVAVLYVDVKPEVIQELARSHVLYVSIGSRVASYSLEGSYAAMAEVFECQRAMDGLSAPTAELVPEKRA